MTHKCLAGTHCAAATVVVDGDVKRREPCVTEEPNTLCTPCQRRVKNAVEDLPFDYVALHMSLGEQALDQNRVQSSMSHPLPIDKHKYSLMTAISENLDRAAEIVSDALNCNPPEGPQAPRIDKAARMVAAHLDKLLRADYEALWAWESCDARCPKGGCDAGEHLRLTDRNGIEFAFTLQDLHRRARSAVGEFEKLIRLSMACGACGVPHVFQHPDSSTVFCRSCGEDWSEALHAFAGRLSRERVEEMDRQERIRVWLEAEKLWLQLSQAEARLAEVRKVANLNPADAQQFNVTTFLAYLKEVAA